MDRKAKPGPSKLSAFFDDDDEEPPSFPHKVAVDDAKLSQYAAGTHRKSRREKEQEAAEAKKREEQVNAAKAYADFIDAFEGGDVGRKSGNQFVKAESGSKYTPALKGFSDEKSTKFELDSIPAHNAPKPKGKRAMDAFLEEIKKYINIRSHLAILTCFGRDQADREAKYSRNSQGRSVTALAAYEGQSGSKDRGDPQTSNVFVANLPPNVSEQSLGSFFARVGPVGSVKIMWPRGDVKQYPSLLNQCTCPMSLELDITAAVEVVVGALVEAIDALMNGVVQILRGPEDIHREGIIKFSVTGGAMKKICSNEKLPMGRRYNFYRNLVEDERSMSPEFDDEGYNSVYSTDSAEESERERVRKTTLGRLARKRFEAMLRALSDKRGEIARCMAFSLEHAEAAHEIADIIVASLLVEGTPVPRKVARLHLICDILHNSAASVPSAWKFRQEFQSRLGIVFDHLSNIYHSFPGRITAETFKKQITTVVDIWEDWIVFPPAFTSELRVRLEGMAMENKTETVETVATEEVKGDSAKLPSRFTTSTFKTATEPASGVGVDEDLDGAPLDTATEGRIDGTSMDDVDGIPIEDVDGTPMEDLDGAPMEDLDGTPMEDVDGTPMEDVDGAPMDNMSPSLDDLDGEPLV
ncbi:SR140 protein [Lentinula edodes]|uniref:SR140 protein n=1 Tax=Lentinula edodes TaxID=5353 RepID=A0A1Q3EB19_LENED|nr:SR140 protein [Lentinula edodes]